jgi:hypothetical protein
MRRKWSSVAASSRAEDGERRADAAARLEGEARLVRLSQNQALFRDVNERLAKLAGDFVMDDQLSFICECSNPECSSQVELTLEEYERVRGVPSWFFVLPGHELPAVEDVYERNGRFLIVEKLGAGKTVALASDPRRQRSTRLPRQAGAHTGGEAAGPSSY